MADYGNNRIEVLNAKTGRRIKSIGNSSKNEQENLYLPYDVVVEVPGERDVYGIDYPVLYVSDSKSRVQVYNADTGTLLRTIGYGHGFEEGELNQPLGEQIFNFVCLYHFAVCLCILADLCNIKP